MRYCIYLSEEEAELLRLRFDERLVVFKICNILHIGKTQYHRMLNNILYRCFLATSHKCCGETVVDFIKLIKECNENENETVCDS